MELIGGAILNGALPQWTTTNLEPSEVANSTLFEQLKAMRQKSALLRINEKYKLQLKLPEDMEVFRLLDAAEIQNSQCQVCVGYPCEKTKGQYLQSKVMLTAGQVQVQEVRCKEYYARQRDRLKRAKLPAVYVNRSMDDYEITPQNQEAVGLGYWLLDNPNGSLYLYGGYGTGKTFLATLIAKELINRGSRVIFGDMPTLLDDIKVTFTRDSSARPEDVIRRYTQCDVLVLDDLGSGKMSDWHANIIYQVVNARYSSGKGIIATSNYNLSGLEKRLSKGDELTAGRIMSRLRGMCEVAYLGNQDRRVAS